jgi:hypothetical protein
MEIGSAILAPHGAVFGGINVGCEFACPILREIDAG